MVSILVIDDDQDFCVTLGESLTEAGYDVRTVFNGLAGLREFSRSPTDVVLVDVIMPGKMEGVETMVEISGVNPDTPIIVMSGGGMGDPQGYLRSVEALGAYATLAKPFERQQLLAILEELSTETAAS